MTAEYLPVPVSTAREIAEKYDKSIVIICAWDPEHGILHTTTYGRNPREKEWAVQGGEMASKTLGAMPEVGTQFEDYRLAQALKLLLALDELTSAVADAVRRHEAGDPLALKSNMLEAAYRNAVDAIEEAKGKV